MSRTRTFALVVLVVSIAVLGASQQSSALAEFLPEVDLSDTGSYTLVKGWCSDICDSECNGECATAEAVGCDCYWLCENGDDGRSLCVGAIGVKVCTPLDPQ